MKLYENRELLDEIVSTMSYEENINEEIIYKDYYVISLLKEIINECPDIIFKGGTSLSKCYKVINRFSEDIDLTYASIPKTAKRKEIMHKVKNVIEQREDLELVNKENIWRKTNYNKYIVNYPLIDNINTLSKSIIIETAYYSSSFPIEEKEATTFIYDYLKKNNKEDIIKEYELEPFKIRVQTIERTFVDKVFAICDYYMRDSMEKRARHIYDLYKLYPYMRDYKDIKELINDVREMRKNNIGKCVSSKDGVNINKILKEIKEKDYYKNDYINNTMKMFLQDESVSYEEAISVINKIIDSKMFDNISSH